MNVYTQEQLQALRRVKEETEAGLSPYAARDADAERAHRSRHDDDPVRSRYAVDADKIIHSPFFNRGSDKTQVFSFYRNDDITRRASHVQLVSRIARTIGRALRLNLDLIEAIAIGHDIGHTPFGHVGERALGKLYEAHAGKSFHHNVHSVRVLSVISGCNLTVQTLDGILCHCGEKVNARYEPHEKPSYAAFCETVSRCYTEKELVASLHPCTLEGCVVRLSDMIAYIGKDRQDAGKLRMRVTFDGSPIGKSNSEIISAVEQDVIAGSFGKPYLSLSEEVYSALGALVEENHRKIYQSEEVSGQYGAVEEMMGILYDRFLNDLMRKDRSSLIFKNYLNDRIVAEHYQNRFLTADEREANDYVVDFIAGMTDDYFLEAFRYLYPQSPLCKKVRYIGYFDARFM